MIARLQVSTLKEENENLKKWTEGLLLELRAAHAELEKMKEGRDEARKSSANTSLHAGSQSLLEDEIRSRF